ncbi:MBL fold metallo-hydrolase [Natronocalculus amylovorans]|uniref:MBL fold metallo-hydrolase n=1 Tax=Natronocalculus amylovorans TaxID=2917812 RepID=A0AAE3FXZ6_9EURY|nr:MBL fold metallo-hydrolase [Natronocalculus amylovorans]MCL9817374.1 MBL fold metallo-hydrolase [Natronocalculus amylovorans]
MNVEQRLVPEQISLSNTVFEGNNNVFLLSGDTTALIDTGVSTPAVATELETKLGEHGFSFEDIDEIFLTHWHHDHAGLAGEIQQASGATVYAHSADAPLIAGDDEALHAEKQRQEAKFDEWKIPPGPRSELIAFLETTLDIGGEPVSVTPIENGDRFEVNGTPIEALHLPGHAAGLTAYCFPGETGAEAFVGDVILPKYTPNVGGADVRVDRPLEQYISSLLTVIDRDFSRVWPGHRQVITEPTVRAATIIEHHQERTERVIDVLSEHGPADVWTVSAELFGSLSNIHILHGPGEAYAHLDHLAAEGIVAQEDRSYELIVENPDVESLFPDVSAYL